MTSGLDDERNGTAIPARIKSLDAKGFCGAFWSARAGNIQTLLSSPKSRTLYIARQSSPSRRTLPSASIFSRCASTLRSAALRSLGFSCEYSVSIIV